MKHTQNKRNLIGLAYIRHCPTIHSVLKKGKGGIKGISIWDDYECIQEQLIYEYCGGNVYEIDIEEFKRRNKNANGNRKKD